MKLSDLIDQLTDLYDNHPDAEIRIASQPRWPMEYHVIHIKLIHDNANDIAELEDILSMTGTERSITDDTQRAEAEQELSRLRAESNAIIYFVEGSHIGYAKPTLWDTED